MYMSTNNNVTLEYIQFSKRVTRWGMILVTSVLILNMLLISFSNFPQYTINALTSLYTAYITIMGITIGAYQGNSSLEKWTRAKYQFEVATKPSNNVEQDTSVIDDIEDTYG